MLAARPGANPLFGAQLVEALEALYRGDVNERSFVATYPHLSHQRRNLVKAMSELPRGLEEEALHRKVSAILKQPVPDRCYSMAEMRAALVSYRFRKEDKISIPAITLRYGPSKATLWRHEKRVEEALKLAGFGEEKKPTREDVAYVVDAIDFPKAGKPTLFLPDEERVLLEMCALNADHGGGKGKRLQINFAKRALAAMADEETDPELKQRLGQAKLSRKWLGDCKARVSRLAEGDYKPVKACLLSQTRAAAKKPGQNAAMFAQIQAKYDELGEAGKLPGCRRPDGHWEPPPHLIYCGDEMGIEPNGKRWVPVLARAGAKRVHRVVTGEHNPFWVTLFFWSRADGSLEVPPCVVHKAARMRGDLCHGLPQVPGKEWLVRASESGYVTKDDWYLICGHLQMHIGPARPAFVLIDGYVNHWDADALDLLEKDDIHVFFLKSQDSDSDQLNDNGPNASVKGGYGRNYDDWLEKNPGVPFSPYFLNPLLVAAWDEFYTTGRAIIVKAAKACGISPFNCNAENFEGSAVSTVYDLVAADKKAESPPAPEVSRTETSCNRTVLQLKAADPTNTLVVRTSAAHFFETSYITPVQELQRALKEQRELKKQTAPLEVDRQAPPDTSVGLWVTSSVTARLKSGYDNKQAQLEEKEERRIQKESDRAVKHVNLLRIGETALAKLRDDRQAKLSNPELQGAITVLGGAAKGAKDALTKELNALLLKKPDTLLALPPPSGARQPLLALPNAPSPAAAPSPMPLLALPAPPAAAAPPLAAAAAQQQRSLARDRPRRRS